MNWPEYIMGFADHAAKKSKDSTQVGAVLVAADGRGVLMTGFNGPPAGVVETEDRRQRPEKYRWTAHAEANLVSTAAKYGLNTNNCIVYVTHAPCSSCARTLIQAGIRAVIYGEGKTSMPEEEFETAAIMCHEAGVVHMNFYDAKRISK